MRNYWHQAKNLSLSTNIIGISGCKTSKFLVERNSSPGEIFVTNQNIPHIRPSKSCPIRYILPAKVLGGVAVANAVNSLYLAIFTHFSIEIIAIPREIQIDKITTKKTLNILLN